MGLRPKGYEIVGYWIVEVWYIRSHGIVGVRYKRSYRIVEVWYIRSYRIVGVWYTRSLGFDVARHVRARRASEG